MVPAPQPGSTRKLCATLYTSTGIARNMKDLTVWNNLASIKYESRTWRGGFKQKFEGNDRYYSDFSRADVAPGCNLSTSPAAAFDVATAGAGTLATGSYSGPQIPNFGGLGSLNCVCNDHVIDVNAGLDLMIFNGPN